MLAVKSFIQTKFPPRRGGASAPADRPRQDQSSPRIPERSTSARQVCATSSTASSSSAAQAPTPTLAEGSNSPGVPPPTAKAKATVCNTVQSNVRAGAIRVEISDPDQWSLGDVTMLQNQEAKRVREIGNLIFDIPLQYDYGAGVEVRTPLTIAI